MSSNTSPVPRYVVRPYNQYYAVWDTIARVWVRRWRDVDECREHAAQLNEQDAHQTAWQRR